MSTTHEVADPYLEERGGVLYVRASRVPLESLVWPWRDGHSAEEIQESYPTLTLAEVYGAIAFYLTHREDVDRQLAESLAKFEAQRAAAQAADPARYAAFHRRLAEARARRESSPPASSSTPSTVS
jgi:uncharacterized protein (DUF433 family)